MNLLKINDNSQYSKDDFSKIKNLTLKITDKTLEKLEREGIFVFPEFLKNSDNLTREQMIIKSVNDGFSTGNVMGFLGYENDRLIIGSRFGNQKDDFFFQYLIEKVLEIPNIIDLKSDTNQENRIFNFLLFLVYSVRVVR